jgi:CubicO group peptidase (beta-lactamase class C family)
MKRRSFLAHAATGVALGAIGVNSRLESRSVTRETVGAAGALVNAERAAIIDAMRSEGVEGTSVCLIDKGKVAWAEGFGTTGGHAPVAVDEQTIFSIQSTSKNFTAVGVLLAVQEGLLDLDVPISRYLPAFKVNSRFESNPQELITLRLLLSHRAGFTHEAPVGNNYEPGTADFAAHVRSISQTWLRYPVGERYRYSNLGFDLAGFILQETTGMPYAEWLRRKLFEPLGMVDSTADASVYTVRRNRAMGHEKGYDSVPAVTPLVASGGVYTSARDMARYAAFHLDGGRIDGKAVLEAGLWNEMHGFGLGGDYGLGVIRNELRYGDTPVRVLSHKGGGFGFGCVFIYCPEAQLAWAAMFNRPVSAPYRFGRKLVDGLLTVRFGAKVPRLSTPDIAPIRPTVALKRKISGTYVGRNLTATVSDAGDGGLELDAEALEMHGPMLAVSPTQFFTADDSHDLVVWTYTDAKDDLPAHLECSEGEAGVDYNEGPADPKGPDRPDWDRYLGKYRIFQWGKPSLDVLIDRRNGYLFINGVKLVVEREPGLFFTSDGEAVDFRAGRSTWRNLILRPDRR